ncbi:MAG: sigma-70 family RNA polymerase sigma factor [Planctomycetes bacterium]|jgi:RNA polymerase sigma factor (TIGR02999 family)|nr:sigma-70 family RNA polymerase sigma factor [Planctomycetota bacterium]
MADNLDITQLLNAAADGMPGAADRLLPVVYEELRCLARRQVSGSTPTLGPTALVHEAWLRLSANATTWNHRGHFFGAAAQAMRRILVEHARARSAQKRGGGVAPVPLDELGVVTPDADELLDLDAALAELERNHPRQAQIVLLRYFAGLQVEEIATALEVSVGTVERDWRLARARLQRTLGDRDQRPT